MLDLLAIASTLLAVAIFLYLRFGARKHIRQIVRSEFHSVVEEVHRLRAEQKSDDSK